MTELYLIALVNAVFCIVCIVILVCRLNSMGTYPRVRFSVRFAHAIGAGAMLFSILRPMIGEWPGYASLLVDVYILSELWSSRHAWRGEHGDTPPKSATDWTPL